MRHVPAHKWADAFAGRLPAAETKAIERHTAGCAKCSRARERVNRASQSFPAIRSLAPPELSWDSVRAKVHWSVSSAKRHALRPSRVTVAASWLALAGATAAVLATGGLEGPVESAREVAVAPVPHVAPAPAPAPVIGLVSRVAGDVMIDGIQPGDTFDRRIVSGTMLATAGGRIDIQFGDASAFAVGARSSLRVDAFDARTIELSIEGTVDVVVAPRAQGQRFFVRAGDDMIEVRGTQFRVHHDAAGTKVECRHGLVAVRDARGEVDVPAQKAIAIQGLMAAAHVVDMSTGELAELARATPVTTPLWTTADAMAASSAPLEIATAGRRDVRVDGVELGAAPLRVRVMPGRHTIEAVDRAGRYKRIGWVDVGRSGATRFEVPAEAAPTGGAAVRRAQLAAMLPSVRASLARCTRAIEKSELARTFVVIDVAIDEAGNKGQLNIVDTELDSATAQCVHDALVQLQFAKGPAATWRERIDL